MKPVLTSLALAMALGILVPALKAQPATSPATTSNVWNGVYSAAQATQGKALYDGKCAICHGAELNGADMAPPLVGASFLGDWVGQSVGDLFTRVHTTMPANDPGSLSDAQTAQAIAFLLSANQFPSGNTALPSNEQILGQIMITTEKPPGK